MVGSRAGALPTMIVKDKRNGLQCVINVKDFNEAKYERVEAPGNPVPPGQTAKGPAMVSSHTREELAVMSMADMRTLPEWKAIDGKGNKQELVEKILAAREKIKAALDKGNEDG